MKPRQSFPRPSLPRQLTAENAAAFAFDDVVEHYPLRPPYPEAVVERLRGPGVFLEMGCGTAQLGRRLAPTAERVDAVDPSAAMLAKARTLSGGGASNIRWFESRAEDFSYDDVYDCILTPLSLHWMDWAVVLPQFGRALKATGFMAMTTACGFLDAPWDAAIREHVPRHSLMDQFDAYDLVEQLESRGLFKPRERVVLGPERFRQTVDDYVGAWWSRAGFARDRLAPESAAAFAKGVREIVTPHAVHGWLEGEIVAQLCVGAPTCED
jgi:SAM-dependent methyltransferase